MRIQSLKKLWERVNQVDHKRMGWQNSRIGKKEKLNRNEEIDNGSENMEEIDNELKSTYPTLHRGKWILRRMGEEYSMFCMFIFIMLFNCYFTISYDFCVQRFLPYFNKFAKKQLLILNSAIKVTIFSILFFLFIANISCV